MKIKSNHKKTKKEEKDITKEVGMFNDFVVVEKKESEKKKEKKNDLSFLDDWILLENPFSQKTSKKKNQSKKSRFSDLFEQIKEDEKKSKEEENIKNDDSSLNKSSINTSSINTNCDSKSFEGNSINSINDSSLSENSNSNSNQIKENKKNEQNDKNEKNDEKGEKIDETNMILDINKVISMEDKRTTIMIKNIPNKFNKDLLLSIINQNFKGTYDLFILPTDINKYKNFGYAFINFTSSYYIPYFYFMFNGKMWSSTNSKKICELTYSKVQGKQNLLGHYPSKIVYGNEEAKNVIPEQKYIIPNVYKIIFNKLFPEEKIEEFKFYFITKMPDQK